MVEQEEKKHLRPDLTWVKRSVCCKAPIVVDNVDRIRTCLSCGKIIQRELSKQRTGYEEKSECCRDKIYFDEDTQCKRCYVCLTEQKVIRLKVIEKERKDINE